MDKFWKAVLINTGVIVFVALISGLINGSGASSIFGLISIIISLLEFIVGLFLLIFPQTRRSAEVMLAASGIIFLIGYSVCSIFAINIH